MGDSTNQGEGSQLSNDEELLLFQLIQKNELNQCPSDVPRDYQWMAEELGLSVSRFQAVCMLFSLAIGPHQNIPFADYYRSISVSDVPVQTLRRWSDWYKKAGASVKRDIHELRRMRSNGNERAYKGGPRDLLQPMAGSPPTLANGDNFFSNEVPSVWTATDPNEWREQR